MEKLLGKIGSNYEIRAPFWCDYGSNRTVFIASSPKISYGGNNKVCHEKYKVKSAKHSPCSHGSSGSRV